jgi:tRNA/tmRNA/rRNA uracil-C5-methylase (TrmA/RlmC/RlmD family)
LAQKYDFVKRTLANWAQLVNPIESVTDNDRFGYRTSVTLAAEWNGEQWLFGTKSMDTVVPIHHCPVHHPLVNRTIDILSFTLPSQADFPLAYLVLSKAQCTLIVKQKSKGDTTWFTHSLKENFASIGIEAFWIHYNPSAGRRLFEKGGWVKLLGNNLSVDSHGLWYGPTAFQQQIFQLYEKSLIRAETFLNPNSNTAIIDLYCGTGTSLNRWRKADAACLGVESGGESVECAKLNAPEAQILRGTCRLRVPQVTERVIEMRRQQKDILLYANPPRQGMEPEVLDAIVNIWKPNRIAYLSCSPGTLNKNLKFLSERGYQVDSLSPFDFFPLTYHVECLAFAIRKDI